jgi:hypothetical protein
LKQQGFTKLRSVGRNTLESLGRLAHGGLAAVYVFGIMCLLLSFGGVYDLPKAIGLGLIALSGAFALGSNGPPPRTRAVFQVTLILSTVLIVWILIQISPLPGNPGANSAWNSAAALGMDVTPVISLAPGETLAALSTLIAPFVAFLSALLIFRNDEDVQRAFRLAAYTLSGVIVFGLLQFIVFPETLLFSEKRFYMESLTSIFVNRNTAGTFLGLVSLIFVVRFCELSKSARLGYNVKRFANGLPMKLETLHLEMLASAILFLLTVLSLLLTQSRGAMASFAVAAGCLVILIAIYPIDLAGEGTERRRKPIALRLFRSGLALGAGGLALAVFGGRTLWRAQVAGGEDLRFCALPGIVEMANDRWLTGWGFGTFKTAFAPYRDPLCGLNGTWIRAHNAYLEAYAGLGIIFWPLLTIAIGTFMLAYWRGMHNRRSMRIYAHVGLCGLLLTLLHSAVDFSVQIPGYAATFAFFSALTITASLGKRTSHSTASQQF